MDGSTADGAAALRTVSVDVVPMDRWDPLVTDLGGLDSYTRGSYHRISVALEPPGTQAVLLHVRGPDGEVALPLLLRPLPDGTGWDATSAYGYGGPVNGPDGPPAVFGAALDEWARERGVVTTFLRLHPLLDNVGGVPATAEVVHLGPTVGWDVGPGRDLRAAMHAHHRRAARRAEAAGLEVLVGPRPASLDPFRRLYEATMHRQQADSYYFFPDAYWSALRTAGDELGLVMVEGRLDGELVAALLCFSEGPWLHYHLGATDDAARTIGAAHRCFLAAAEWAQARGLTTFHLGGGVGADQDAPLLTFKRRFDPTAPLLRFSVAKIVHDRDRYRALAGTSSTAGFFPPWRRGC